MSSVSSKRFSIRSRTRGDFRNEKIDDDDDNNNITYNMIPAAADTLRVLFFAAGPVKTTRCVGVWGAEG